jgi:uncharacterized OB-fold protein
VAKTPPPTLKSKPLSLTYYIPTSKTQKFWDGIKEGKLYTTKCKKCKKLNFPPIADCPTCLSSNMEWVELSGKGEIETFTHIPVKPASFQSCNDYTIAIARLNEGVRVLAWLTGAKLSDTKVGMKVKLVAKTTPEGMPTYEFVPI